MVMLVWVLVRRRTYEQLDLASWQGLLHLQAVLLLPQLLGVPLALLQGKQALLGQLLGLQLAAAMEQIPGGGCKPSPACLHLLLKAGAAGPQGLHTRTHSSSGYCRRKLSQCW